MGLFGYSERDAVILIFERLFFDLSNKYKVITTKITFSTVKERAKKNKFKKTKWLGSLLRVDDTSKFLIFY